MKSHKTSSSTRFSPIFSPLPLPQHLDVQPPTYHKIPPVFCLRLLGDKTLLCITQNDFFKNLMPMWSAQTFYCFAVLKRSSQFKTDRYTTSFKSSYPLNIITLISHKNNYSYSPVLHYL